MTVKDVEIALKGTVDVNEQEAPQNLSKEVIEYLSKEIETTTNNLMVFRSKISLAIFLGPFIVLGSVVVASKGLTIALHLDNVAKAAILIGCFCFIMLAYTNAEIEQHGWTQCDKWRRLIGRLHKNPSLDLEKEPDLSYRHKAIVLYFATYSLLLLSFISAIVIISKIITTLPNAN